VRTPKRILGPAAVAVGAALAASPALTAATTFSRHGVTFQYPAGWTVKNGLRARASAGKPLSTDIVGLDDVNLIEVQRYRLNRAVPASALPQLESELTAVVRGLAARSRGRMTAGPTRTRLGTIPGLAYRVAVLNTKDVPVTSRLVFGFRGRGEYLVNCQHAAGRAGAVERACALAIRTFRAE